MLERVAASPEVFVSGCVVWIPVVLLVLRFISWGIQGDLDAAYALTGIFVAIGLGIVAVEPPAPFVSPLIFLSLFGALIALPFAGVAVRRRDMNLLQREDMERAYATLGLSPQNPSAKFRLAQCLYTQGMIGSALALAENALTQMPVSTFANEHKQLAAWKRYRASQKQLEIPPCPACGFRNAPESYSCQRCAQPHLMLAAHGVTKATGVTGKVVGIWLLATLFLVGIPITVSATAFPVLLRIVLVLVQVGIGIFILVRLLVKLGSMNTQ